MLTGQRGSVTGRGGLIALAACAALGASQAMGASVNWKGQSGSDSDWNNSANWEAAIPGTNNGTNNDDVAIFRARTVHTVNPDSGRRIRQLLFAGSTPAYTIGTIGGPALTLSTSTSTTPSIVNNAGNTSTNTINSPLIFLGNTEITAAAGLLLFKGTIATPTGSATTVSFVNHTGSIQFDGIISGDAKFLMNSTVAAGASPRLINFNAANTFTGGVTVNNYDATLLLNNTSGSATGSGDVIVKGLLAGDGAIVNGGGNGVTLLSQTVNLVRYYARLSPGASNGAVGILEMDLGSKGLDISDNVADTNTQSLLFDLGAPAASDKVSLLDDTILKIGTGGLEFDDFVFSVKPGFIQSTYTLFSSASSAIDGTLGSNVSGTVGGYSAHLEFANGGKDLVLVVPEPASVGLLAIGALGLLARRRRMA